MGERSVSLSKMVLYYKTHLALLRKEFTRGAVFDILALNFPQYFS